MGRVYDCNENPSETVGLRLFLRHGAELPMAYRVEFDDETDAGMATVYTLVADSKGMAIIDYKHDGCECIKAKFRDYVVVVRDGETVPDFSGKTLFAIADGKHQLIDYPVTV